MTSVACIECDIQVCFEELTHYGESFPLLRRLATEAGWTHHNGRDYCPAHKEQGEWRKMDSRS